MMGLFEGLDLLLVLAGSKFSKFSASGTFEEECFEKEGDKRSGSLRLRLDLLGPDVGDDSGEVMFKFLTFQIEIDVQRGSEKDSRAYREYMGLVRLTNPLMEKENMK